MNMRVVIIALSVFVLTVVACSPARVTDGWYRLDDYSDQIYLGEPLLTVEDIDSVVLIDESFVVGSDTVSLFLIQGCVKPAKREYWADETERLIGHRVGFVYNDSVVCSPCINTRIESGNFQITSPDTSLIRSIYNSFSR